MVDRSVPQRRFENLAQRHDLLVHRAMCWRLATGCLGFFESMDAIFIDLARSDFGKNHAAEEWYEITIRTRMLTTRVGRISLSLRHDVELAQI